VLILPVLNLVMMCTYTHLCPHTQGDIAVSERLLSDLEDLFLGRVNFVTHGHQHAYGGLGEPRAEGGAARCKYPVPRWWLK
jgi:hypothetical protein